MSVLLFIAENAWITPIKSALRPTNNIQIICPKQQLFFLVLQSLPKKKEETNTGQEFIVDTVEQYSIKLKVRLIYLQFAENVNWRLLG